MIFLFGIKIYRNFNISRDLKKYSELLNKCFDLEKRSAKFKDSMKLIENCLKNMNLKMD